MEKSLTILPCSVFWALSAAKVFTTELPCLLLKSPKVYQLIRRGRRYVQVSITFREVLIPRKSLTTGTESRPHMGIYSVSKRRPGSPMLKRLVTSLACALLTIQLGVPAWAAQIGSQSEANPAGRSTFIPRRHHTFKAPTVYSGH